MSDNHIVKTVDTNYEIESTKIHPLVQVAMRGGEVDTQTLKELMDLQDRWEKNEAKKAYTGAMVQLKRELPATLAKDKRVDFGNTHFAFTSLASAMNAVSPMLTQYGFSLSWTPVTAEKLVSVTCRLTHTDGHFEEATLSASPDSSGSKNPVQAVGSTISYLQRYTALSLLGIATADMKCVDELQGDKITIDANKNLDAVAYMHSQGIKVSEAEAIVEKGLKHWNTEDLSKIKDWIKDGRKPKNLDPRPEMK